MSAFTPEVIARLRAPFVYDRDPRLNQHEVNYDGFIYIAETATCERLDEVDPAWQFEIVSVNNRAKQAVVQARLTILGVSRGGVGMSTVNVLKDKPDVETNEAEKGAATDALRRCARLFGVGRYLLDAPKAPNGNWNAFEKWYLALAQPQDAPQTNAWTEAQIRQFVKQYRAASLTDKEVLGALGVSGLKAWTGTLADAQAALDAYIARQLAAGAAFEAV